MATWIAHLRISEKLLEKYNFERKEFLVGSIAPDSGIPNEDRSEFEPPKKITHWINEYGTIEAEVFFDKYVSHQSSKEDKYKYSFLVGYYFHLIADIEWSKLHNKKKENPSYKEELDKDSSFIWVIKKDWYGLDFKYLKDNPNSIFFKEFIDIIDIKDYLNYFPSGAFNKQIKYIIDFYLKSKPIIDRNYKYLTEDDMEEYIINTTKVIERIGKEKKIILI